MRLSEVRDELADIIRGLVPDAHVYAWPPPAPLSPALVLVPDEPYLERITVGRDPVNVRARFRLTALVAQIDNAGSLGRIEQLLTAAIAALPSGIVVGPVSRPGITTVGPSDMLVADLLIEFPVELDVPAHLDPEPDPDTEPDPEDSP